MRLMTGKRADTLLELMYLIEYFTLARAWEGLTDDELNVELNRTTLSIDIGRHIIYKEDSVTLNLEAQSDEEEVPALLTQCFPSS